MCQLGNGFQFYYSCVKLSLYMSVWLIVYWSHVLNLTESSITFSFYCSPFGKRPFHSHEIVMKVFFGMIIWDILLWLAVSTNFSTWSSISPGWTADLRPPQGVKSSFCPSQRNFAPPLNALGIHHCKHIRVNTGRPLKSPPEYILIHTKLWPRILSQILVKT